MNVLLTTSAAPLMSPFSTDEKRPSLGLGFLIAVLRDVGHKVFFIDNYLRPSDFLETGYLLHNEIDLVGIYANTICYRDTRRMLLKMQAMRKKGEWKGKIMVGGPHTAVALETIPDFVDYIVQGEGERAIIDILEGNTGHVVRAERIRDLDSLPMPAWEYFAPLPYDDSVQWFRDRPVFTMNTSRGCPFNCAFCSVDSIWGKQYTYFSPERMVSDIEYLIKTYGARGIYFREDNFTLNRKRVINFCELLLRKGIKIKWVCETRVDTLDYDLISLMYRAGCRAYYLGVESGNQRLLDFMRKGITIEQTERVFKWCHQIGMKTAASFIVGIPTETEEERAQTIYFAKKIKPTTAWFNVFVGIPRSELYEYVLENNLYEYIDDRGLVYLEGHDQLVEQFYGGNPCRKILRERVEIQRKPSISSSKVERGKPPKVSVIMSVYNAEKHVKEAIDSILNQTFSDFEFIIVNDGSTDRTSEILKSYTDLRLIIVNQANKGVTRSLNKAIEMARGQYIARMDADDISLPQRLQMQVEFLEEHPAVSLVGTSVLQIDEDGKIMAEWSLLTESAQIKKALLTENQFCHGSVMFRRERIEKVGGYREEFERAQDYDLWLRIAEHYEVANLATPLYKWRFTANGISVSRKIAQDQYATLARQCAERRRRGEKEPLISQGIGVTRERTRVWGEKRQILAWYHYTWGRALLKQERMQEARLQLGQAIKNPPFYLGAWVFYLATYLPSSWLRKMRPIWHKMRRR